MKLTKFLKLRKAVESLDANLIARKIGYLETYLQRQGLDFEHQNTAITQEGIFYIEPESGVATKVIVHVGDFPANLSKAQISSLVPEGYVDKESIEKFHPYHIMRCNVLTQSERDGWKEAFRISKRTDGQFFYRIVSDMPLKDGTIPVYQEIEDQTLYICQNCMWKVSSILPRAQGSSRESFQLKMFFDVEMMRSWNSRGMLSKDYGFTEDMYPDDWLEICRIRKEQVNYHCESCFDELADPELEKFLYVHASDHVEGKEGYVRLECFCLACLAELPSHSFLKSRKELEEYIAVLKRRNRKPAITEMNSIF